MSPVARAWVAFAAVGSGIIHLALAVHSPVTIVLALLGILEFGWGLFVMAAARLVAPRATIAGVFVAVAASVSLLFVAGGPPALPLLIAALLALFIAVAVALSLRRPVTSSASTRGYVLGMLGGSLVVGVLVFGALAAASFDNVQVSPGLFVDEHGH